MYTLSGHSVVMGKQKRAGQIVEEILLRFGNTLRKSRQGYLEFIHGGALLGRRDDLVGGGLQRSRKMQPELQNELEISGERILGSGDFIERLRREEELQDKMVMGMQLPELAARVEEYFGLEKKGYQEP